MWKNKGRTFEHFFFNPSECSLQIEGIKNAGGMMKTQFWFGGFFYRFYFIYFWLCWVFVAARGLSLVAARGGYSSLRCAGFSLRWLLLLQSSGSRAQAQ